MATYDCGRLNSVTIFREPQQTTANASLQAAAFLGLAVEQNSKHRFGIHQEQQEHERTIRDRAINDRTGTPTPTSRPFPLLLGFRRLGFTQVRVRCASRVAATHTRHVGGAGNRVVRVCECRKENIGRQVQRTAQNNLYAGGINSKL